MTKTKSAACPLPLTNTPCRLLHNQTDVSSHVLLKELNPQNDLFTIAPSADPKDVFLSFTIAKEGVTLFVHNPEDPVLNVTPELEHNLPRMTIVAVYATDATEIYRHDCGAALTPPVAVTRSGSDTDLIIGVNFDGSTSTTLPPPDGAYCELFWRVNSSLYTLCFAAATAAGDEPGVPLILRPRRQE